MRVLVLGGTLFLGRLLVEAASERGHQVTLFNRGRTNPELYPEAEHLRGDRDGDLTALEGRAWDAVLDPSGYVPRVVRASVELLSGAAGHYTFISSGSVYPHDGKVGVQESSPTVRLEDESTEDVGAAYGGLKALCEQVVEEAFPDRALVIRAGLIVGPLDWTNRFGYWVRRIADGGEVLVPGPPHWTVQFVDGRDLAAWIVRMAEDRAAGTYNATGPESPIEFGTLAEECVRVSGSGASLTWVDEDFLLEHGVEPFTEMPLWLALGTNPEYAGFNAMSAERARAVGLAFRPLAETIADTLAWERERSTGPPDQDWGAAGAVAGLDREREAKLLEAWHERRKS